MTDNIYHEIRAQFLQLLFSNGKYNYRKWQGNNAQKLKQLIIDADFNELQTFEEKIWGLINDTTIKPKCYCGKALSLKNIIKGFYTCCSVKCSNKSVERLQKIQKTNLERYGCISAFGNKEIQKKSKQTLQQRYGVDHNWKIPEVKENIKQVCLEKYGAENVFQSDIIKDQIKVANIEKYGVENPAQNDDIKNKYSSANIETYKSNTLPKRLKYLEQYNLFPYQWSIEDYEGAKKTYKFHHLDCDNIVDIKFLNGQFTTCPLCKRKSKIEQKLANELQKYFPNIILNSKKVITPYEIDILIDNIGIEVNGVYWHRDHINQTVSIFQKTKMAKNINLFHFWDYELNKKFDVCVSLIIDQLTNKIIPNNLTFHFNKDVKNFIERNSLYTYHQYQNTFCIKQDSDIIMACSFIENDCEIIIEQFCKKIFNNFDYNILFNELKKFYNKPIIIKLDNRYQFKDSFNNFMFLKETLPNTFYLANNKVLLEKPKNKHIQISDCGNMYLVNK